MTARLALLVALAGCHFGPTTTEHVRFAQLGFDLPEGWRAHDTSRRGYSESTWTPLDNDRRESIVVVRNERVAAVARAGFPTISRLLAEAQRGLGRAKPGAVNPLGTPSGLTGAMVTVVVRAGIVTG